MTNIAEDVSHYTLFPWSKQSGRTPLEITHSEGVYFYDAKGKSYLDFSSQLINVNIGHNHPKVKAAIEKQLHQHTFIQPGMATEVRAIVGKKLSEIAPGGEKKTFFTLAGADAVESAVRMARAITGKEKILSFNRSYHGGSIGALSLSGDPRRAFTSNSPMPNVVRVENPYAYRCPWRCEGIDVCNHACVEHIERIIQMEGPGSFAAFLFEGESGTSGCIKYPPGYLKKVTDLARKHDILLIADEVMSGFGRTGQWFGVENHEVEPDMICVAKGLTSGYLPLGGVIISQALAAHFNDQPLPAGLTYSAHSMSLAAAMSVLEVYEEDGLIENARKMGNYMESGMERLKDKHPSLGDFRNTGLLGCIELVKDRHTKTPLVPWNSPPKKDGPVSRIYKAMMEKGLSTLVRWNLIFIAPPLCIDKSQIDQGLSVLDEVLSIADEHYQA